MGTEQKSISSESMDSKFPQVPQLSSNPAIISSHFTGIRCLAISWGCYPPDTSTGCLLLKGPRLLPWRIPAALSPQNHVYHRHFHKTPPTPSHDDSPELTSPEEKSSLTHLTPNGSAHMISISHKQPTSRVATAVCSIHFSSPLAIALIRKNQIKKGDVLAVARVAGIMAAKRTTELVPLCHNIALSAVEVEFALPERERLASGAEAEEAGSGGVDGSVESVKSARTEAKGVEVRGKYDGAGVAGGGRGQEERKNDKIDVAATVKCDGKTGVEMEALMAASTAALTVYDMCKAVDRAMVISGLRVVLKEGGKTGKWIDGVRVNGSEL